jgi:hypothetical protein
MDSDARRPLLKTGRRYRMRQDLAGWYQEPQGRLNAGRELNLLRAEYSFVPYMSVGGWHFVFADAFVSLEDSEQASVIAGIDDYFEDIGPFDWRTEIVPYARFISGYCAPANEAETAAAEHPEELVAEIEAVLRAQPASREPLSPQKAFTLAAKRLAQRAKH